MEKIKRVYQVWDGDCPSFTTLRAAFDFAACISSKPPILVGIWTKQGAGGARWIRHEEAEQMVRKGVEI